MLPDNTPKYKRYPANELPVPPDIQDEHFCRAEKELKVDGVKYKFKYHNEIYEVVRFGNNFYMTRSET